MRFGAHIALVPSSASSQPCVLRKCVAHVVRGTKTVHGTTNVYVAYLVWLIVLDCVLIQTLSVLCSQAQIFWHRIRQMQENDCPVYVTVTAATRGGLLVQYQHLEGFIPASHIGQVSCSRVFAVVMSIVLAEAAGFNQASLLKCRLFVVLFIPGCFRAARSTAASHALALHVIPSCFLCSTDA